MTSGVFSTLPEDIRSSLPSSEDVLTRLFPPSKGKYRKLKKNVKSTQKNKILPPRPPLDRTRA